MRKKIGVELLGLGMFIAGVSGIFGWSLPVALIGTGGAVVAWCEVHG